MDFDEAQRQQLQDALSVAFGNTLIKENSKLTKFLADCWAAQAQLDEALVGLREQVMLRGEKKIMLIGEAVEQSANELKQTVTLAVN